MPEVEASMWERVRPMSRKARSLSMLRRSSRARRPIGVTNRRRNSHKSADITRRVVPGRRGSGALDRAAGRGAGRICTTWPVWWEFCGMAWLLRGHTVPSAIELSRAVRYPV
jgi:hypothetical protein